MSVANNDNISLGFGSTDFQFALLNLVSVLIAKFSAHNADNYRKQQ
jgi:hypothetical protein